MKVKYDFQMPLVQGTPDDITKDELRVVTQPDGTIDILKRDVSGNWVSICKGGKVANPEMPLYATDKATKFNQSLETLLTYLEATGDGQWHTVGKEYKTYTDAILEIKKYLPKSAVDSVSVTPNVVGFTGYNTSNGGFKLATLEYYLEAQETSNAYALCKVPINVPQI